MKNIFKKQFLLGLLVISMPAIKGWPLTSVEIEQSVKSKPEGRCIGCDLQNKDLRETIKKLDDDGIDIYIADSNLTGADLSGANMREGHFGVLEFIDANLSGATFSGTRLRWVNFTGADLSRATFENVDLLNPNFTGANLSGATFIGMDLTGVDFSGATGRDVRFI